MEYTFSKHKHNIYSLQFFDRYDLCMHFLRLSEYHEHIYFQNKYFTIVEYMDWYTKDKDEDHFTYTLDWEGFNLTHIEIDNFDKNQVKDWNQYDDFMFKIFNYIKDETDTFSLLGYMDGDVDTFDHELAHAMFAQIPEYKKLVLNELHKMQDSEFGPRLAQMQEDIKSFGYAEHVALDEQHAYLATTNGPLLKKLFPKAKIIASMCKPFINLFKTYREQVLS